MRIDIDGPSAVGKTTLIRSLCQNDAGIRTVDELLMQKKNPYLSWETEEAYLQKQLWFFDQTLQRYTSLPVLDGELQINDIGITDVIVHTWVYPRVNLPDWDIWRPFVKQVKEQFENLELADLVIYLHAKEEVLRKRQQEDIARVRGAFESNLRLYAGQKQCYAYLAEAFPEQVYLVEAEGTSEQVKEKVWQIMEKHQKRQPLKLYQVLDAVR